jgi:hydroxysqualene synthase
MAVDHYENFPVASVLCPPRLRAPIMAIYHFARTADDLADEGDASPAERLADLAAFRAALTQATAAQSTPQRWPGVFTPLASAIYQFQLPVTLLHDLISAFEQDVRHTAAGHVYADHAELLAYCALSANPVGRLLLHLYGIDDATALTYSDRICSALQLINFWQDVSVDVPRGRHYLTGQACARHGVDRSRLLDASQRQNTMQLVATEATVAAETMRQGQQLAKMIPGRAGWELRLVVQGGLRIADKILALGGDAAHQRPKLTVWDGPLLLWRALRM